MYFNDELEGNKLQDFGLTTEIKDYLQETAKWTKFISIVGFIFVGIMVLGSLFMGFAGLGASAGMPFPPILFSLVYLVFALIALIPLLYLYRFSSNMQAALNINDQLALTESFKNLKSFFKFYGIYLAVILCLYGLMLMVGVIAGVGSFVM